MYDFGRAVSQSARPLGTGLQRSIDPCLAEDASASLLARRVRSESGRFLDGCGGLLGEALEIGH